MNSFLNGVKGAFFGVSTQQVERPEWEKKLEPYFEKFINFIGFCFLMMFYLVIAIIANALVGFPLWLSIILIGFSHWEKSTHR